LNKKISIEQFAISGGKPFFEEKRHVNKPSTPNKQKYTKLIEQVFQSGVYSNNGPLVQELEEKIARHLGVRHCVLSNNGTLALALLLIALDIKGHVIVPSFTFISTPHLLNLFGITPIFCDIDKNSHNLSIQHCEALVSEKTTAIIATHLWGIACNVEGLQKLADKKGVQLVFDASHSFGCKTNNQYIGGNGIAEFFSFHATKFFHTFEGGCITTNDTVLAKKLKEVRNFGFIGYDKVAGLGINAKMTEVCAAAGLVNLTSLEQTLKKTQENYLLYKEHLNDIPGISLIRYDLRETNSHYIVLTINEDEFGLKRDKIIEILHKENVIARRYFYPGCHKMKLRSGSSETRLAITETLADKIMLLPGGASITEQDILAVCSLLKKIYLCSDELGELMAL